MTSLMVVYGLITIIIAIAPSRQLDGFFVSVKFYSCQISPFSIIIDIPDCKINLVSLLNNYELSHE